MSPTDDAKLVVDSELGPQQCRTVVTVPTDVWKAAARLATAYVEAGGVDGGGCPWCGASLSFDGAGHGDERIYDCGSISDPMRAGKTQTTQCKDRQIATLTARLATMSADLAEHKRRLMEQSAVLNAVRQERDAYKRRVLNLPE